MYTSCRGLNQVLFFAGDWWAWPPHQRLHLVSSQSIKASQSPQTGSVCSLAAFRLAGLQAFSLLHRGGGGTLVTGNTGANLLKPGRPSVPPQTQKPSAPFTSVIK